VGCLGSRAGALRVRAGHTIRCPIHPHPTCALNKKDPLRSERSGPKRTARSSYPTLMQSGDLSLTRVTEHEVVKTVLLVARHFAGRGEERQEQLAEVVGTDTIEIVFSLATGFD
jgi:hypothetical protein